MSIELFFIWPAGVILAVLIALWLFYDTRASTRDKPAMGGRIYRCEHCRLVYAERRNYPVLECPRCHHPNPAIRR